MPAGVYDLLTEIVAAVPVKVGCETVPAGVYVAVPLLAGLTVKPVALVPVNVGAATVPAGV